MEQMIFRARRMKRALRGALRSALSGSLLLSSVLCGPIAALLALYSPAEGAAPFGLGCAAGAWYAGISPYFACAGAFIGYALTGSGAGACASVLLGAAIAVTERFADIQRVYRLLIAFGVEAVTLCAAAAVSGAPAALALGCASVSVLSAVILGQGFRTAQQLTGSRDAADSGALTLAASLGMITLAIGRRGLLGQSFAVIFAGVCVLLSAYRCGIISAAFAVMLGAGRALATGGDMHFIAVLAAGALAAASLRSFGRAALAAGFAFVELLFRFFSQGSGMFSPAETALSVLFFMLIPSRLYMPVGTASRAAPSVMAYRDNGRLEYDVSRISEVLSSLAGAYGGSEGRLCSGAATALRRCLSRGAGAGSGRYAAEAAFSAAGKSGSEKSGDSFAARRINDCMLICLSDGMGSGEAASLESRQAVELLCDLLTVGFDMCSASDCVNGLLSRRARGDMYATLDAVLIDLSDCTAGILKLGAPPSYVLRGDRLYTLYAENLPVGVVAEARQPVRTVELKRDDVIIMLTDGAAEALGSGLLATVADAAAEAPDEKTAAERILAEAVKNGRGDDMTVAVVKVTRNAG